MVYDVRITDNSAELLRNLDSVQDVILEALGLQAVGYAQLKAPVDTGLLRNSLTHAIAGEPPAKSEYQSNSTHASTEATQRAGTAGQSVNPVVIGKYKGSTTKQGNEKSVYIGTNVEYAPYQELGGSKTKAQPFLKPALTEHIDEYKKIIIKGLKGELTE